MYCVTAVKLLVHFFCCCQNVVFFLLFTAAHALPTPTCLLKVGLKDRIHFLFCLECRFELLATGGVMKTGQTSSSCVFELVCQLSAF